LNIIYITYWGINDGLSQSTVWPNVKILASDKRIDRIYLISFERGSYTLPEIHEKVTCLPIVEHSVPKGLNKFISLRKAKKVAQQLANNESISLVICRSVFSGIIGIHLKNRFNIPFVVESYEPHADYMVESNEWKPNGLKSKIIRKQDELIRKVAFKLYPVSNNYLKKLQNEEIKKERLEVIPCSVDVQKFCFNQNWRSKIKKEFHINEGTKVGVYVGKFGGIYFKEEAYELFKSIFEAFNSDFFLFILTPESRDQIVKQLNVVNFPVSNVYINQVRHEEVPQYLSASDFAFSTIKPSRSRKFCSPIKDGEYWANGLPILITQGVGDDSYIIEHNEAGVVFDLNRETPSTIAQRMVHYLQTFDRLNEQHRQKIVDLAIQYRSFAINKKCYSDLIDEITVKSSPST
jgi:glycosyltransferase involved in cell wall biosynthesis